MVSQFRGVDVLKLLGVFLRPFSKRASKNKSSQMMDSKGVVVQIFRKWKKVTENLNGF